MWAGARTNIGLSTSHSSCTALPSPSVLLISSGNVLIHKRDASNLGPRSPVECSLAIHNLLWDHEVNCTCLLGTQDLSLRTPASLAIAAGSRYDPVREQHLNASPRWNSRLAWRP